MDLYIVRHGETLFNKMGRMQGWCDSPLTEKGIKQAKQVRDAIKNIDFVYAYSSTSERTIDTLEYILEDRDIPRKAIKGLKEFNFGTLEAEDEAYVRDVLKIKHEEMYKYGGDRMDELTERFKNQLLEIAKKHPEGNVLCVSHGGVLVCLLMEIAPDYIEEKMNQEQHPISNCQILHFESDGINIQFIE